MERHSRKYGDRCKGPVVGGSMPGEMKEESGRRAEIWRARDGMELSISLRGLREAPGELMRGC